MSEPAVLTDVADGVMTITINRPAAKNAVNKDVAVGIAAALDQLDADDKYTRGYSHGCRRYILLRHGSQSLRYG